MPTPTLLAVPNISEGRDETAIAAIGAAFAGSGRARLLDTHSDRDHHRTVFTLAGYPSNYLIISLGVPIQIAIQARRC